MKKTILPLLLWLSLTLLAGMQTTTWAQPLRLLVTVTDETGVPVASAQVFLTRADTQTVHKGETDAAGRYEFVELKLSLYTLRVEKPTFYTVRLDAVRVGTTENVEVTLNHEQEIREAVNVDASPPAIDPTRTEASETLNNREIINLPYPAARDYRNVLPFLPGVVQDVTGQVHINGSATRQIVDGLDGFNVTQPATGLLTLRVSPDALREISVQGSRYGAEHGKGSGGVLSLTTGMGDDRYRFSATDFMPSLQSRKGVNINGWTPRATFSGPLRRKKAWFFDAADADYNLHIVNELPKGADRNNSWRVNNLAKAQVNLRQTNILTATWLVNNFYSEHAGLTRFDPIETTRELKQRAYLATIKDQAYFANGLLLEIGVGVNQYRAEQQPLGRNPYVIRPGGTSGNYFRSTEALARRAQFITNLSFPSVQWHGRHEFKTGVEVDRLTYWQFSERRPIFIRRDNGTRAREITFISNPRFKQHNVEFSVFAQDRWLVTDRLLVEAGLRMDWDEIIRRGLVAPRFASSYLLTPKGTTRLSAGVGLYFDATSLDLITRPFAGRRWDFFYDPTGSAPYGIPITTSFQANNRALRAPRYLNVSVGLEQQLPAALHLRLELIGKRGHDGFTFAPRDETQMMQLHRRFELHNERRDRYEAVSLTLRRAFKDGHEVMVNYTRSSARSNAVLDFNLDNVIFSPQLGGRMAWDAPNRLLSWGWLPFVKKFDVAYSLDWRSGYPFSLVNQEQRLIGAPNARRFPDYFSLNLHAERRFQLMGIHWAVRAGFNNLTNRQNPTEVNNNIDSAQFLTFGSAQGRSFVGRIRFLGRK